MASLNSLARELAFKVVYVGPGLSGKTTSLRTIFANTRPEHRGEMVSLPTPIDRALEFEYLPIRVPHLHEPTIRLQLFTVPGQIRYDAARKMVLTGADGVVFVADSHKARADANVESLRNLEEDLREQGRSLDEMPHVLQYNKRDEQDPIPVSEMEQRLNLRAAPSFATAATQGEGIYEVLEAILRAVMEDYEQRAPERIGATEDRLSLPEGGLAAALRIMSAESPTGLEAGAGQATISSTPSSRASSADWQAGGLQLGATMGVDRQAPGGPSPEALSFGPLWSGEAREQAMRVEAHLAAGSYRHAIIDSGALVRSTLKAAALEWPVPPSSQDLSEVAWSLGFDASRWRWLVSVLADVEQGKRPGDQRDALVAYACAIGLTLAHRHSS